MLLENEAPAFKLFLQKHGELGIDRFRIESCENSNKRVLKDLVIRKWSSTNELVFDRKSKFTDSDFLWPFDITAETSLWCQDQQKLLTLKEYVKKFVPEASAVTGYAAFPPGDFPKKLTPTRESVAKIIDPLLRRVFEGPESKTLSRSWSVRYDADKKCIRPTGIVLVNTNQWSLQAMSNKVLD